MANFESVKTAIDANVNTNGTQKITGGKMNSVLHQMVDATETQLAELEQEQKKSLQSAHFDPAKTSDYVTTYVKYQQNETGRNLVLGVELIMQPDIENAAENDLDNGISNNGLVTALDVKEYVESKVPDAPTIVVDQVLDANSPNAISNKAVAEAIASAITKTLNTEV